MLHRRTLRGFGVFIRSPVCNARFHLSASALAQAVADTATAPLTSAAFDRSAFFAVERPDRALLRVTGADSVSFLQGLCTADVRRLDAAAAASKCDAGGGAEASAATCAAFLDVRGRTLFEALLVRTPADAGAMPALFLEVSSGSAAVARAHLMRARVRARVKVEDLSSSHAVANVVSATPFAQHAVRATLDGGAPQGAHGSLVSAALTAAGGGGAAFVDPRSSRMGVRVYAVRGNSGGTGAGAALGLRPAPLAHLHALRLLLGLPEGAEVAGALPLEWGLHLLGGVAFDKGCYLGQELVARAHFRGAVRRRFLPAYISSAAAQPAPVACADPLAACDAGVVSGASFALPFAFLDMRWNGGEPSAGAPLEDGTAASTSSRSSGGNTGNSVERAPGRVVAAAGGGSNLVLISLRLDRIAHVFAPQDGFDGGAADVAGAPEDDDFSGGALAAAVGALHERCAGKPVDLVVSAAASGGGSTQQRLRVTPVLPPYWRRVLHMGEEA